MGLGVEIDERRGGEGVIGERELYRQRVELEAEGERREGSAGLEEGGQGAVVW